MSKLSIVAIFFLVAFFNAVDGEGATLISEDFDDQNISPPLDIYQPGGACTTDCNYSNTVFYGSSGYSVEGNHAASDELRLQLSELETYLDEGVYFRYWVYYPSSYLFPKETGEFDNVKMLKFAGSSGWDIEFIYKNTDSGGPSNLQLYWNGEDGTITGNGTGTGNTTLGATLSKGVWHKLEVYMKLGTVYADQAIHVQVDDYDVYQDSGTSVNFRLPASVYSGTRQFASIRASNSPPNGEGLYYFDNVTVVHNEGDLCDAEPNEPSGGTPVSLNAPKGFQFTPSS